MQTKICSSCNKRKKISKFGKNKRTKDGYHYYCKLCRVGQQTKDWSKYKKQHKNKRLQRTYGITLDDYIEMYKLQKGVCLTCGAEGQQKGLQVDHCHKTGKVRGLLCISCNTMIGRIEKNPLLLSKIKKYLG